MEIKKNPWESIAIQDYEGHMMFSSVGQLQMLNALMKHQFAENPAKTIAVFGVAGGNGLEHIDLKHVHMVYGIDVQRAYLAVCKERYGSFGAKLQLLQKDLSNAFIDLPEVDLVVANLLIEYIGIDLFGKLKKCVHKGFLV